MWWVMVQALVGAKLLFIWADPKSGLEFLFFYLHHLFRNEMICTHLVEVVQDKDLVQEYQ